MINRTILAEIKSWLNKRKFIILNGARQVGKTTLLKVIEKEVKEKKAFLFCDNLDFLGKIKTPDDLIFYLKEFHDFREDDPFFLFLDEFQYLKEAGLFLKNLYDQYPNLNILASGSSSLEIAKNSEFLTGRSVEFFISPISFREFFQYQIKKEIPKKSLENFSEISRFYNFYQKKLESSLEQYLSWGGYPEIVTAKDEKSREKLLEGYAQKYLEKDVASFLKIENVLGFNNLIKLSADSIGRLVNINEISNTLNLAHQTVKKYFSVLEGTYVLNLITPFYRNVRSEVSKMPKVFFNDLGLRNYLLGINSSLLNRVDLSFEVENFVFNILQNSFNKKQIHFYRTNGGSEIDFLVEKEINKYLLIEVKYRSKVRRPAAFKNFSSKYPQSKATHLVITKDLLKKEDGIYYIPASLLGLMQKY